jgi:hypothetical protein
MSTSDKTDAANRHHGGPGSSHQRPDRPDPTAHAGPNPGAATSDSRSHVSGGGGERDRHHTHDPDRKVPSPRSH